MDILLLSTADWDHPFWTNKQHVAVALAKAGHRVVYLESLGLRQPTLARQDRGRLIKRLRRFFISPRLVTPRLWVVSPLVLPGIRSRFLTLINRFLLSLTLLYVYLRLGFNCDVLWTYSPATTSYLNPRRFKHSLYHCVDDIGAQPKMPTLALDRLEFRTAANVEHVVVTTVALQKKLQGLCSSLHLMPNVVDYEHFAESSKASLQHAKKLMQDIPKPIIGFVGAISSYKIDFNLLADVADARPDCSFVMIGAIGEGDSDTDVSELQLRNNIFFLGPQSYQNIPACMAFFDVAILPSRLNTYTEAMFPMKFFEYFAAGLPVVAVPIPSLSPYRQLLFLCDGSDAFIRGLDDALASLVDSQARIRRKALAGENTYVKRTNSMLLLLNT